MSIFVFGEDLSADGDLKKGQVIERTILMAGKEYRGQGDDFVDVTPAMLNQAVNNFEAKAAGDADLAVNFSHDRSGPAGAWIKGLAVSDDSKELIAKLKVTGNGAKELNEGNYRYPSIEMFKDGFQRNDGEKFSGCVIVGCAFLNNPQQKGIKAVTKFDAETALAELDALSSMELMSVVERALELMSDLSDEEQARLNQILGRINDDETQTTEETQMADTTNPEVIKLQDQIDILQKQNSEATKRELFSDMLSTGHITPAQQESFMALDVDQAKAFKDVRVAGKPELDFSEIGTSAGATESANFDEQSGSDRFHELVSEKVKKDKLSFADAMEEVSKQHPELNKFAGVA
jgi:phage I-like protein